MDEIDKKEENTQEQTCYVMKFDKNTINHLGIQLYSSFSPVLGELLSNSYDAEAENVNIYIYLKERKIIFEDDGHGMSNDSLNSEFLVIGRNRRNLSNKGLSRNGKRKVTGKKGLGKLAVFGVASKISVITVSDGLKNGFILDYSELMKTPDNENYRPKVLFVNEITSENNGTIIILDNINEDKEIDIELLKIDLAKRFNFFGENFKVKVFNVDSGDNENDNVGCIDKKIYWDTLSIQYEWKFPDDFESDIQDSISLNLLKESGVSGYVVTNKTPLRKEDQGFNVLVRGKFATGGTYFNERANDRFHEYVTGYFNLDIIDEDIEKDVIATARQNILWDASKETKDIKCALNILTNKIGNQWRIKRDKDKNEEFDQIILTVLPDLFEGMSPKDQDSLRKIKDVLAKNTDNEVDLRPVVGILDTIKTQFKFETFKSFITQLNDEEITIENMSKIANDWEAIETKELAQVATGRIEAIRKLQQFVTLNASETKAIQPFLEKFPWLLDPRITSFDREITFKEILKKQFPDESLEQKNRRIDFLINVQGKTLVIVELKRPSIKISAKEILQAGDYKAFILKMYRDKFENVETYLVSENLDMDDGVKVIADGLSDSKTLVIKSYSSMINTAMTYHNHFITRYEEIKNSKKLTQPQD